MGRDTNVTPTTKEKQMSVVFWNDPDEGICSGFAELISVVGDVATIKKDGVFIEVLVDEISEEPKTNS